MSFEQWFKSALADNDDFDKAGYAAGESAHAWRIRDFMAKAGQALPDKPCVPDGPTRLLRAKLIFEEACRELIGEGLAVDIFFGGEAAFCLSDYAESDDIIFKLAVNREPDLVKIADGAADASVVVNGTLLACGINGVPIQAAVDAANLQKFEPPVCPGLPGEPCGAAMQKALDAQGISKSGWLCLRSALHPIQPKEFGPYKREDGKHIKPPYWKAPDIAGLLEAQGWENPDKPKLADTAQQSIRERILMALACAAARGEAGVRISALMEFVGSPSPEFDKQLAGLQDEEVIQEFISRPKQGFSEVCFRLNLPLKSESAADVEARMKV